MSTRQQLKWLMWKESKIYFWIDFNWIKEVFEAGIRVKGIFEYENLIEWKFRVQILGHEFTNGNWGWKQIKNFVKNNLRNSCET